MEGRKTRAEVRKIDFDHNAEVARGIGDSALRDIDDVLADQDAYMESLRLQGIEDPQEFDERLVAYNAVFHPQTSPNFYQ